MPKEKLKDSFIYRKGYVDGLNDADNQVKRKIIEAIEGGFITDIEDLKEQCSKYLKVNKSMFV